MSGSFTAGWTSVARTSVSASSTGPRRRRPGQVDIPTGGPDAVMDRIDEMVTGAVGIARGPVGCRASPASSTDGKVLTVPNLANWFEPVDVGVGARVTMSVCPWWWATTPTSGCWGSGAPGRRSGVDDVLGVWLGTGMGGAFILDGRPFNGSRGAAGEIGHVIVRPGGALCGCGRRGCVEAYAGRRMMSPGGRGAGRGGTDARRCSTSATTMGKDRLTSRVWAKALDDGDRGRRPNWSTWRSRRWGSASVR